MNFTFTDSQGIAHNLDPLTKPANQEIFEFSNLSIQIREIFDAGHMTSELRRGSLTVQIPYNSGWTGSFLVVDKIIDPSPDGNTYLLADLRDIRLYTNPNNDHTLMLTITDTDGQEHQLKETYTPTAYGLVIIQDVDKLLRPYFSLPADGQLSDFTRTALATFTKTVQLKIAEYAGSVPNWEYTFTVAYSDTPTPYLQTHHSDLVLHFLQRDNQTSTASNQPCSVSFWGGGDPAILKVKILAYFHGVPLLYDDLEYYPSQDALYTYHFTLQVLSRLATLQRPLGLNVEDIIYVDFQLFDNQGEAPVLRDSVRFMHDRGHRAYERTFAFIGPMGEPEFVAMTGRELREAEFEGTFLMEHHNYRKADTKLNKIHTSYTGPLTEGGRDLIWDMAASPWVYTIEAGQLVEVTITEVELTDSSPHTEPVGLTVKWRYADEYRQRTFKRTPHTPHLGVFDETFDETFE